MSSKYKFDITYVFGAGRKAKLSSDEDFGKEFFYGYPYFKNKNFSMNIIETVGRKRPYIISFLISSSCSSISWSVCLRILVRTK